MTDYSQSYGVQSNDGENPNNPDNPNDGAVNIFDDLTCPICKFKSEQPLQFHYGGMACFSCRAFFRRAHQKTKSPNFMCKRNDTCEVTVKTRRRCQKCRYLLCLKNGKFFLLKTLNNQQIAKALYSKAKSCPIYCIS